MNLDQRGDSRPRCVSSTIIRASSDRRGGGKISTVTSSLRTHSGLGGVRSRGHCLQHCKWKEVAGLPESEGGWCRENEQLWAGRWEMAASALSVPPPASFLPVPLPAEHCTLLQQKNKQKQNTHLTDSCRFYVSLTNSRFANMLEMQLKR